MVDNNTLEWEIEEARQLGCVVRVKRDSSGCVSDVSIGKVPGMMPYRKLGQPGAGWMRPIAAHSRLQEVLSHLTGAHGKCQAPQESAKADSIF